MNSALYVRLLDAVSEGSVGVMWQVRLFGGLTAQREGHAIVRPQSGRLAAVLATLAYRPGVDHPRHVLAEAIWPDKDEQAARHCLRQAIVALRHILEPPGVPQESVIVASRACIQLNPEHACTDVQEFEQAVDAIAKAPPGTRLSAMERAVGAYGGELLPGLSDEWVLIERERLAAAYLRAVQQAIMLLDAAGQRERALEYALISVGAAPTSEECAVVAMRLCAQLGRASTGVQAYKTFRSALRRECEAAPSKATQLLARDLRRMEQGLPVRSGFALPAPRDAGRTKLPHRGRRLVGRESELAELIDRLRQPGSDAADGGHRSRLTWLTGPGGCGKTRLAVEAAQALTPEYDGAVWFVPLAHVTDPARFAPTILDLMGGPKSSGGAAISQVAERLSAQPSLLILDNLEQIQEQCASVVVDLVAGTPSVVCLVTSRDRLGGAGAIDMELEPLSAPPRSGPISELLEYPAVQLFVDRGRAVSPTFDVTPANAAAVVALCRRLDGLPLAIELAASRSGVLTPTQMLSELAGKSDILVTRQRDQESRHCALRDTISWSYSRLSSDLKRLFAELSVFRGGWSLTAARDVCQEPMALDHLEALWERSMVWVRESGDEMRFGMLETMREYAGELLSGRTRELVRARHAEYYLRMVERAAPGLAGVESGMWLTRLQSEQGNIYAALERIAASEDGLRMANALGRYWRVRGEYADGREWLTRALDATSDSSPSLRARGFMNRGMLAVHAGQHALAQVDLTASLSLNPVAGDESLYAEALIGMGVVHTAYNRFDEAIGALEQARSILAAHGDRLGQATALSNLGRVAERQVQLDDAACYYTESAAMFRECGDEHRAALVYANTGAVLGMLDRNGEARTVFEKCIPVFRRYGDRSGLSVALVNLAEVVRRMGDPASSLALLHEAVPIQLALGDRQGVMLSLWSLASLGGGDDPAKSVRIMSALLAFGATDGLLSATDLEMMGSDLDELKGSLAERDFAAARQAGRAMSLDEAIRYVLSDAETGASETRLFSDQFVIGGNP